VPADATVCPDCHEDLGALRQIELAHVIRYNEALALARDGKLGQASAKLLVALDLKPTFTPARVLLAKVYARQERWPEALESVAMALQQAPDDASVRALAEEVSLGEQEALTRAADQEEADARARRARAEQYVDQTQRDVARAFGFGFGAAAVLALGVHWLFGRRR